MLSCGSGPSRSVMSATMKGCEIVFIEADRQRRVLVSERGQEGGHEAVPRDLAHRGQHAFVEGRLAQLLARKVDLDSDGLDHVPPQDCEMRFAHRLHGMPYTHVGPGSLDPVRGTYRPKKLSVALSSHR